MTSAVLMERSVLLWSGDVIGIMTVGTCQMNMAVNQVRSKVSTYHWAVVPPVGRNYVFFIFFYPTMISTYLFFLCDESFTLLTPKSD